MENFGAWIEKASPKQVRKARPDVSDKLSELIEKTQSTTLKMLEAQEDNKKLAEKRKQENSSQEKACFMDMKAEEKRTAEVCQSLGKLQMGIASNEKPVGNLKKMLESIPNHENLIEEKEKLIRQTKETIEKYHKTVLENEKDVATKTQKIVEPIQKKLDLLQKMNLVKKMQAGSIKNQELEAKRLKIFEIRKKVQELAENNEKLDLELTEAQNNYMTIEKNFDTIHEDSAERRSQLVKLEVATIDENDADILEKRKELEEKKQKMKEEKESAKIEIEKLSSNVLLVGDIDQHDKDHETKVADLISRIEAEKSRVLENLISQIEEQQKIRKLKIELLNAKKKFAEALKIIEAKKLESKKMAKEKKVLKTNLEKVMKKIDQKRTENEILSQKRLELEGSQKSKPAFIKPKLSLKRRSTTNEALNTTVDLEETSESNNMSMNNSNLNNIADLSKLGLPKMPKKMSSRLQNSINAVTPPATVPTVMNTVSTDPFENAERMVPLLTSTPIVADSKRPRRSAATKRPANEAFHDSPPPVEVKKRNSKPAARRGRGRGKK